MQHDEVIWQVIRHNHCSFMTKITTGNFCRNPYNVTGICNRSSCPLANSRYATIREDNGVFYLYMKTIERAHMPKDLWERVKLPRNYEQALEVIDKHLMYWPKLLVHKVKQRLTKMTQMRIRMRKLALKTREKITTLPRKEIKREARREKKAEKAAVLDKSIENELVERHKKGLYQQKEDEKAPVVEKLIEKEILERIRKGVGDIYNYPVDAYNNVLDMENLQPADEEDEEEEEIEYVEGYNELEEEDDIEDFGAFSIHESQGSGTDDENDGSSEDEETKALNQRKAKGKSTLASKKLEKDDLDSKSKKTRVLVEVECDDADQRQRLVQ
ncbi:protein MAK16 protein B [Trifolium repens]|nr:protein MAK16 protein B [Trifolium repens]